MRRPFITGRACQWIYLASSLANYCHLIIFVFTSEAYIVTEPKKKQHIFGNSRSAFSRFFLYKIWYIEFWINLRQQGKLGIITTLFWRSFTQFNPLDAGRRYTGFAQPSKRRQTPVYRACANFSTSPDPGIPRLRKQRSLARPRYTGFIF